MSLEKMRFELDLICLNDLKMYWTIFHGVVLQQQHLRLRHRDYNSSISIGWRPPKNEREQNNKNKMLRRRFNTLFVVIFSFQSKIKCKTENKMLNWLKSHSHSIIPSTMHLSRVSLRSLFSSFWFRFHCVSLTDSFFSECYSMGPVSIPADFVSYADVHPIPKLTKCSSWVQKLIESMR